MTPDALEIAVAVYDEGLAEGLPENESRELAIAQLSLDYCEAAALLADALATRATLRIAQAEKEIIQCFK